MGTALQFMLPWGQYHANPWGRSVNESAIEWPPSPWRVLRALFSSWMTRMPDLDASDVERVLNAIASPPRFWLPEFAIGHTRHYLPGIDHRRGVKTDTAKTLDTFVVTARDAALHMEWPIDLGAPDREILGQLVAGVGYLGRAESIVEGRLAAEPPVGVGEWCSPSDDVEGVPATRVLAPTLPLDLDALVKTPARVRNERMLRPPATRWIDYSTPVTPVPERARRPRTRRTVTALRLSITGNAPQPHAAAVALGDVLRRACIKHYSGDPGGFSATLSGKDARGTPHRGPHTHAHYLAFTANAGHRRVLDSLLVWAPAGLSEDDVLAISRCRALRAPNGVYVDGLTGREIRLGVEAFGDVRIVAPELVGPARTWTSLTPYAPTRHRKGTLLEQLKADVGAELAGRDLPSVVAVDVVRGDWLRHRRYRTSERLHMARRAYGLTLQFAEPIVGPLALGQLSHFGLGLFVPTTETAHDRR